MSGKPTAQEKREAAETAKSGWPKSFEWEGQIFTLPHPDDWPLDALVAFEENRQISAIRHVLGDQWRRIGQHSVNQTKTLFDALAQAAGFTSPGE